MTATAVMDRTKPKTPAKQRKRLFIPSPYPLSAAIKNADVVTWSSVPVFGLGNILRGQYVKGAIFLFGQVAFIYMLFTQGLACLAGLGELGPVTQGGQEWDENGNFIYVNPTQSVQVLLFGIAWVLLVIAFLIWWATAFRSAYKAQVLLHDKGKVPTFVQDLKDLLDNRIHGTLMTLPTLGIFMFTILPLLFMMALAFTDFDRNHPVAFNWIGFQNFASVLSQTGSGTAGVNGGLFLRVLVWTLVWAILATFLNFFLGMFMAMIILRKGTRLKGLWRTCFSMSIAVPQFVSLLTINQMLQGEGIVNQMLRQWGWIETSLPFFTNAMWARATVIIVNLWVGIPFTIMQITAILQNIPSELYEASKIDGASGWQTYIHITMPYIFFVATPYLITTFTGNINNFNVIFFLSNGAPTRVGESAGQTDLFITWLYKLTVDRHNYNVGAVIGILTFVVLATVSLITYRNSGSYKNEEGFR